MANISNRELLAKLPAEKRQKILDGAALMNAQRAAAKKAKQLAADKAAGILQAA